MANYGKAYPGTRWNDVPVRGPMPFRLPRGRGNGGSLPIGPYPRGGDNFFRPPGRFPDPGKPLPPEYDPRRRPGLPVPGGELAILWTMWNIAGGLDKWKWYKNPNPFEGPHSPWYLHQDCGRVPGDPPYGGSNNGGAYAEYYSGHVSNCLDGQVLGSTRAPLIPYQPFWTGGTSTSTAAGTLFLSDTALTPARRARHDRVYWINNGNPQHPVGGRWRPYYTAPDIWQEVGVNFKRWYGTVPRPYTDPKPEAPPQVPDSWAAPLPHGPMPRTHWRENPGKNVRENKNRSLANRIGVFLWHLMDVASELSEIPGAIYKALPKEVRKKWNCGSGVNIGQYGSDVNVCMMKALWHNLDKLDTAKAVREISKNIAEDLTIGEFEKLVSKVMPKGFLEKSAFIHLKATLGPEKAIAKVLDDMFKYLGV